MPYLDNPAGRLHHLLAQFAALPSQSVEQAWAAVLHVSTDNLAPRLGEVAVLAGDVIRAAEDTQEEAFIPAISRHIGILSPTFHPTNVALNSPKAQVDPNATSMEALSGLSTFLHRTASEGAAPDPASIIELRTEVSELMALAAAADLDPAIRNLLLKRLADVLAALDHLDVGGPDAARKAADALAFATATFGGAMDEPERNQLKAVARKAWILFQISVTTVTGLHVLESAVSSVDHLLSPPPIHQLQLPAGSPADVEPPVSTRPPASPLDEPSED